MKIAEQKTQLIDWDKQQLLITQNRDAIVLTDGLHNGEYFSALSLDFGCYKDKPHYYDKWVKSKFIIYEGVISND